MYSSRTKCFYLSLIIMCDFSYTGPLICDFSYSGPLFENTNGRFLLIGINAGGIPCESNHHPKIFTSISAHANWINANLNINGNSLNYFVNHKHVKKN